MSFSAAPLSGSALLTLFPI
jgi:hypothetical protein